MFLTPDSIEWIVFIIQGNHLSKAIHTPMTLLVLSNAPKFSLTMWLLLVWQTEKKKKSFKLSLFPHNSFNAQTNHYLCVTTCHFHWKGNIILKVGSGDSDNRDEHEDVKGHLHHPLLSHLESQCSVFGTSSTFICFFCQDHHGEGQHGGGDGDLHHPHHHSHACVRWDPHWLEWPAPLERWYSQSLPPDNCVSVNGSAPA